MRGFIWTMVLILASSGCTKYVKLPVYARPDAPAELLTAPKNPCAAWAEQVADRVCLKEVHCLTDALLDLKRRDDAWKAWYLELAPSSALQPSP